MNIFLTSPDPVACAQSLDNRRVIKMALETAQLLSCAIILRCDADKEQAGVYGLTHQHHPCARWARHSMGNFLWLVDHGVALCDEYRHRFAKRHKSLDVILRCRDVAVAARGGSMELDNVEFTFNSSAHKHVADTFIAYRMTMMEKWTILDMVPDRRGRIHPPKWSDRGKPEWYDLNLIQ